MRAEASQQAAIDFLSDPANHGGAPVKRIDTHGQKDQSSAAIAKVAPAAFEGLFLTASFETRLARVGARSDDASDAGTIVARKQKDFDLGHINWTKVDASGTPRIAKRPTVPLRHLWHSWRNQCIA